MTFLYLKGSASVETIILSTAMVPLILGIMTVGRQQKDTNQHVQIARYVAWERTVSNDYQLGAKVNDDINARFVDDASGLISSVSNDTAAEPNNEYRLQIIPESSSDIPTLASGSINMISELSNGFEAIHDTAGSVIGSLSGLKVDWVDQPQGVYTNTVEVAGSSDDQASKLYRNTIMVDSWGANGPAETEERVRNLLPGSVFRKPADIVAKTVGVLPIFKELRKMEGQFGEIDATSLPGDRKP